MNGTRPISFGDKVKIRTTPDTKAKGVAGLVGQVYGETKPSVTGVEVIGALSRDYAVNVCFEGRKETFWFATELVEFVDHAAGTEIRLDGVAKKWVRNESGQWVEEALTPEGKPFWKHPVLLAVGIGSSLVFAVLCFGFLHMYTALSIGVCALIAGPTGVLVFLLILWLQIASDAPTRLSGRDMKPPG